MKILALDIWGDLGHFRKFYTTTSPLTFSFPPPPTIAGMLGAIYGTNKYINGHLAVFGSGQCKIALRILKPIKKVRHGVNLLETKGSNFRLPMSDKNLAPRTQIRTEFLKDPCFRIFVNHKDDTVFNAIVERVRNHMPVYSVSLGLSELLADFKCVGVYDAKEVCSNELVDVSTTIVADSLDDGGVKIEEDKKYFKERMPIIMNQDRVVDKYEDVVYEPDGKTIKARLKRYWRLDNGENIVFFF